MAGQCSIFLELNLLHKLIIVVVALMVLGCLVLCISKISMRFNCSSDKRTLCQVDNYILVRSFSDKRNGQM